MKIKIIIGVATLQYWCMVGDTQAFIYFLDRSKMTEVRLNDITLPQDMLKELSLETLKEINAQDEATFYEFFQGMNLPVVRNSHSSVSSLKLCERYIN